MKTSINNSENNISEEENDSPPIRITTMQIIHTVALPPRKPTLEKLKNKLSEFFFHDDPLHKFKNQSISQKFFLGFQYFFPVLHWIPNYSFTLFRSDIISGITIASLAIPQGISYAKLANLPPIIGLYSSFVPPLIYTVLGSSRHLGVGPVSIASLVMGTMLGEIVSPVDETILYMKLAFTATLFAGIFQAALGLFRLGFIIDFLSKPNLIGFMAGAAIVVSMQQLKGLLGIKHFTKKMQIIPVMHSVFEHRNEWTWQTVVMGISLLVFLLTTRHISIKKPKLFWISAAAPLTSVIVSTLIVFLVRSKLHAVSIVGKLPRGVNPSSTNMLSFSGPHLGLAIKTGIITGILSLTEGIAVGRTFATMQNYQVDGNKEMTAIGVMNMIGSCVSCYITSGSFSRSAVNYNAGAKSAMSNIVMAAAVLITLLFLMPLFYYTPNLTLAAIIITAVIGLIDYKATFRLWKADKLDFLACMCSFFGVLFISVQIGLAIAGPIGWKLMFLAEFQVGVSVLKILLHVTRPNTVALGNIPDTQIYQSFCRYETAQRVPSFLILGIESPIYFANSNYLSERILRWVREEEDRVQEKMADPLKCVILDMTAVTTIDTSGIDTIHELKKILKMRSLELVLVNPAGDVMERLHRSKVLESFRSSGLYLTIGEAVADISSSWKHLP